MSQPSSSGELARSQDPSSFHRRRSWRDHIYPLRCFTGRVPDFPSDETAAWRVLSREEASAWMRSHGASLTASETHRVAIENGHGLLLAEVDGRIVGRCIVGSRWVYIGAPVWSLVLFPEGMAYFYGIQVDPAYRGRGLGRACVVAGLKYARAAGLTSCALWIARRNTPSVRSWMGLGIPWFDTTRLVVSHRGVWVPRSPWSRFGVTDVVPHRPWA